MGGLMTDRVLFCFALGRGIEKRKILFFPPTTTEIVGQTTNGRWLMKGKILSFISTRISVRTVIKTDIGENNLSPK